MDSTQLHDYLLTLKNKSAQDPDIQEKKREIRAELEEYRSNIPRTNLMLKSKNGTPQNIVFYYFMEAPNKPKIGEHEYKRLKLSWSSLRKYNTDIEIRFCYKGDYNYAPAKSIEM